jgi:DNA-binding transcriptional regulator YbjK
LNHPTRQFLCVFLFTVLLITGCASVDPASEASSEKEKQALELTAAEVLAQAIEASENQAGVSFSMTTDQNMIIEADGTKETINTTTSMDIETTQKPFAFYMKGSIEMDGESLPSETYFADSTYYVKEEETDEWYKLEIPDLDEETMEELINEASSEDPQQLLKQLESFADSLALTYKDGTYIITLELDEEQAQKYQEVFVKDQLDGFLDLMEEDLDSSEQEEMQNEMDQFFDNVQIEGLKQTIHIDEKTFEYTKVDQELRMVIAMDSEKMTMDQKLNIDIKGKVDTITVPDEVKNNAVDMSEMLDMSDLDDLEDIDF